MHPIDTCTMVLHGGGESKFAGSGSFDMSKGCAVDIIVFGIAAKQVA